MKRTMPKPSKQFVFAAVASVLAMSALALSAPAMDDGARGGAGLIPMEAGLELPHLPALPTLIPLS